MGLGKNALFVIRAFTCRFDEPLPHSPVGCKKGRGAIIVCPAKRFKTKLIYVVPLAPSFKGV